MAIDAGRRARKDFVIFRTEGAEAHSIRFGWGTSYLK